MGTVFQTIGGGLSLLLAPTILILVGCGKAQDQTTVGPSTQDGRTAREYLQSVFIRYRDAQSYCDDGIAELSYENDGRLEREQAPLSVWMNGGKMYVRAYDVHVLSEPKVTTAWIVDPSSNNHDSQVLRAPPSDHHRDPQKLLADPVLKQRVSAGLAGPPPQLEWLFAAHPMERLFAENHDITFGQQADLDGRPCLTVLVDAEGDRYRFWIDQRSSLIHRVDLPSVTAPGDSQRQGKLTLALNGATFDVTNEPAIANLPKHPQFVSRFIPLPPPEPADGLGRIPAPFRLIDQTGQIRVSNRGSDREVTVLLFVDVGEAAIWNVIAFNQWASMMTTELASRVRSIVVTETDIRNKLPADLGIPIAVDRDQRVCRAITDANRGVRCALAVIDREGRIAWLQKSMSPHQFAAIGPIIGDVLDGVDVPGRLLDQWRSSVASYRNLLDAEIGRVQAAKLSQ